MDYVAISENFNAVRKTLKIEEVIQEKLIPNHATLKKEGHLYFCRCPLHKDENESMIINPKAGFFYCRECHASGDVFRFIAMMEKVSIYEASNRQAKQIHAELLPSRMDFANQQQRTAKREIAEINNYARDFYHEFLTSKDDGAECRKFLNSCGISSDAIEKFQLGFAPDMRKQLAAYLYNYDFPLSLMIDTGLIANAATGELEDKLQRCLVIPVMDFDGNTQKLIGRPIDFDKKVFYETDGENAEYIETTDSAGSSNCDVVFGFSAAKKAIISSKQVLIVSGYLDMIILHSAGVENVVTVLDFELSNAQAEEIIPYADRIIFLTKNKQALQIEESVSTNFEREEIKLFVVSFSTSPVKFLQARGKDAFLSKLKEPVDLTDYKFFKKTFSDVLSGNSLLYKMKKLNEEKTVSPLVSKIENLLMGMATKDAGIFKFIRERLPDKTFSPDIEKWIGYLEVCFEENIKPNEDLATLFLNDEEATSELLQMATLFLNDEEATSELLQILKEADREFPNISQILEDAISTLERLQALARYSNLTKEFLENSKNMDDETKLECIKQMAKLKDEELTED